MADGGTRTTTPGILSDLKESELDDVYKNLNGANFNNDDHIISNDFSSETPKAIDEFPILDELDRLAKVIFK